MRACARHPASLVCRVRESSRLRRRLDSPSEPPVDLLPSSTGVGVGHSDARHGGPSSAQTRRRHARLRGTALALLIAAGVAVGVILATSGPDLHTLVGTYVRAWVRHDYRRMYSLLDPTSRRGI